MFIKQKKTWKAFYTFYVLNDWLENMVIQIPVDSSFVLQLRTTQMGS